MEQVQLGASGLRISPLALGMMSFGADSGRAWQLDESAAEPIVRLALERGVTFFDTADMYAGGESEAIIGRLLRKLARREDVVVATKVFYPMSEAPNDRGLSRRHSGVPPAQVALAWLLHKPAVTAPIVGATRAGHLEDAVAALSLSLSPEEIARLEEPYRPHPWVE